MTTRILFHVAHLLGIGHLRRAAALAGALADAGFAVTLVSGGMPVADPGLGRATLVQLPPMRAADVTFKTFVDEFGALLTDAWRAARRAHLLDIYATRRPDVVITELFPFGRRMLEFELLPLLDAIQATTPRPLVLSSVRDILAAASTEAKAQSAIARLRTHYAHVLVHGDAEFLPLTDSFPQAAAVADRLAYTGYVQGSPGREPPPGDGVDEVIVSVGGGAVGARLLATAMAARALSQQGHRRWRLLAGGEPPAELAAAARTAGPGVVLERARPDFPGLLRRCHVSVSQSGYNTVMDILTAGARSVVVPFAQANETEQTQRAAAMARHGWAQVVAEADLTPALLAAAIDRAAAGPRPHAGALRCDGAAETVRLISGWVVAR